MNREKNENKLIRSIPFTHPHTSRYDVHLHSFLFSLDEKEQSSFSIVDLWTRKSTSRRRRRRRRRKLKGKKERISLSRSL